AWTIEGVMFIDEFLVGRRYLLMVRYLL
ncbi:MAG: hypothetical protein JWP70_1757, partial [Leifsonia sp.]|nr:hypothetical protein [Leifsonia sp.]